MLQEDKKKISESCPEHSCPDQPCPDQPCPDQPCSERSAHTTALGFALTFLTRLGTPRLAPDTLLAQSISYYSVVGLILGLILCGLVLGGLVLSNLMGGDLALGRLFGSFAELSFRKQIVLSFTVSPYLWAWLYVLAHLWLTRGLHHDGLADVVDALGATPSGSLLEKAKTAESAELLGLSSHSSPHISSSSPCSLGASFIRSLRRHFDAFLAPPLADAQNSATFWRVVKDSHLGAFGAMALIMALGGEVLAVAAHVQHIQHSFSSVSAISLGSATFWLAVLPSVLPLLLAPVFARTLCTLFICVSSARSPHSLGGKVGAGKSRAKAVFHALLALALCLPLSFTKGSIASILAALLLFFLWRLARKYGGYNGDFLGMLIVCGQLIYIFCM